MNFTKRRFLTFELRKQHKKCSELLKNIHDHLLSQQPVEELLAHYHELQNWMNTGIQIRSNIKEIANAYHQHLVLAEVHLQEHNLLNSIKKNDKSEGCNPWPISIYLDHLRSAHNVGSIIRTVEAFALGAIHFSTQTPFIDNKQVQDSSMGAYQWVQCFQNSSLSSLPKPLVVLETSTAAVSLSEFIFPEKFTLAVGNEEYGSSDELLQAADYIIEIPLRGRKNSLNVANAFAIAASEIQRQKGKV